MAGGSANTFDVLITEILRLIQPKSVLDIGPGQGKNARLLQSADCSVRPIAIEIDPSYSSAFELNKLYKEVRIGDAADLPHKPNSRNEKFDCVMIGDCIEHMPKSRGLDLLNFLTYRSGWIILVAPEFSYYDTYDMAHTESHISVWSEFDFQWHDRFAYMRAGIMQMILLRGYLPSQIGLEHLIGHINSTPPYVLTLEGKNLKPAHLQLFSRPRLEAVDGNIYSFRQP